VNTHAHTKVTNEYFDASMWIVDRMKGLAFAYDPDGYWVEIVKRNEPNQIKNYFNFSQTMLRIKDPSKSIPFYEALGMKLIRGKNYGDFSNYFLASASNVDESVDYSSLSDDEAKSKLSMMFGPVLELTHNHGTEKDEGFKHYNGNEEGRQGFGHIGFLVDDVYAACDSIREMGYGFKKVRVLWVCNEMCLCCCILSDADVHGYVKKCDFDGRLMLLKHLVFVYF
jgi:lactoylglutathione lyase